MSPMATVRPARGAQRLVIGVAAAIFVLTVTAVRIASDAGVHQPHFPLTHEEEPRHAANHTETAPDTQHPAGAETAAACEEESLLKPFTVKWYIFAGLVLLCIICAALAAGLTMGLVSVDVMKLRVAMEAAADLSDDDSVEDLQEQKEHLQQLLKKGGSDVEHQGTVEQIGKLDARLESAQDDEEIRQEASYSRKILPIVSNHHLLLVTLLLTNALANECMPIFLDRLVPSWAAVLLSVTFVLVFGEIVPSAIFTGKHQLRIAAFFTPMVWVLIYITGVIAWPISKLLDCIFHHESGGGEAFNRDELKAFIRMHGVSDDHRALVVLRSADDPLPEFQPCPPPAEERRRLEGIAKMHGFLDDGSEPELHHARFCITTHVEIRDWLGAVFREAAWAPGPWDVVMHPLTPDQRLHLNKTRASVAFKSEEDAQRACNLINDRIKRDGGGGWMHGWVRTQAHCRERLGAVRMNKLQRDECAIITGCLDLSERTVGKAAQFHQLDDRRADGKFRLFMLPHNTILDAAALRDIAQRSYSRIPIYQVHERAVTISRDALSSLHLCGTGSWGEWNKVTVVGGHQDLAGLPSTFWVSEVAGTVVRCVEDYTAALPATGDVTITVYDLDQTDRGLICGVLLTKQLITISGHDRLRVSEVEELGTGGRAVLSYPLVFSPQESLLQALVKFRRGDDSGLVSHLAMVSDRPDDVRSCWRQHQAGDRAWAAPIEEGRCSILGMVTLEDITEEFLGDIEDESDRHRALRPSPRNRPSSVIRRPSSSGQPRRLQAVTTPPAAPGERTPLLGTKQLPRMSTWQGSVDR
eukprot:TRINITY_DN39716_c0_g1_i1.p1 TRINITY_DN39716_c0_g1~~TRINITY_DN39716_c0_g1_i1.p1  ORF type:complete len:810 (+),score=218.63 TRINITY_DN39716_c0_g1_i1:63-2492(+)